MTSITAPNSRRTTLIVAVVLAIGTGWLTLNYLSSLQRASSASGAPHTIFVAAKDIPARVTITPNMVATISRPASAVEPGAITDQTAAIGALSLITIPAGATITSTEIGRPGDVGLPVRLKKGMRAVSIQIDKVKGVSGLIEPGDRVDVIAIPPRSGNAPPPASTILRGVRVLAIGDSLEVTSATPSPQEETSTTATLEVTPKQADLIAMADLNTTLRLALRSPKEPINSEPTEALHFPAGEVGSGPALAAAPSNPSADIMKAFALGHVMSQPNGGGAPAPRGASRPYTDSAVQIIDGDHYAGYGSSQ